MRIAVLCALLGFCFAPGAGAEVRWQLDFKAGQTGTVTTKGVEGAGNYGYLTFTVTNKTGRDVPLSLGVWAETDVAGRKYRGSIDPAVKAVIERRTGKTYKSLTETREPLADGASADILVTFGKLDPNVDALDIHVLGLVDRVYKDRGRTLIEEKALILNAARPGDEFLRQNDLLKIKSVTWKVLAPAKELRKA